MRGWGDWAAYIYSQKQLGSALLGPDSVGLSEWVCMNTKRLGHFFFHPWITALFSCTRNAQYIACWSVSRYMGQGPGCLAIKMLSMGGVGIDCWTVHRQLGLLLLAMVFQTTPWPLNLAVLVAKPASQPRASTFSPRSPSSALAGSYAQRGGPR